MRKQLMMALLLVAGAFSVSNTSIKAVCTEADPFAIETGFPYELEQKLLEKHAAPHWQLSVEAVWLEYKAGIISIREVEQGKQYVIARSGQDLIEVVLGME